jgi:Dolichyl-phosphate-mannose-protein mannosyltransferase
VRPPTFLARAATSWGAVALAWTSVVCGLALWLGTVSESTLRDQLRVSQFWSLEAVVAVGLAAAALVYRDLRRRASWDHVVPMGATALLAVVLTLTVSPRTNRIFYDEHIYQGIGQNLAELRLAQMCHDGTVEYGILQCASAEYNKQPYAYPHLLSVGYRLVGVSETVAHALNLAAIAIAAAAIYLVTWYLFSSRPAAALAALVFALTPQQLWWSATAAVEPTAAMAVTLSLLAALLFCRHRTTASLVLTVATSAWAVQFRPESALVVPLVLVVLWQRAREELGKPRLWWAGLLGLVLLAVHAGHLVAVRNEGWGTTDARMSFAYVLPNLRVNGVFFLWDRRFPALYTVLAAWGAVSAGRRGLVPLSAFAGFFGVTLLFYAGSYNYGADVRYSLMTYPSLAMLAGLGAASLATSSPRSRWGHVGVVAALVAQFTWYLPATRATGEEAWAARADVTFARAMRPALGGNTYVLSHNPGMFHLWGINAGQMSLVAGNPSYVDYLASRYPGGVYVHWGFWCNVQVQAQRDLCAQARAARPTEAIGLRQERDYTYAFYRVLAQPESRQP